MPFLGTTGGGSVKQYGGQANLGYFIKNSLRFRGSASAYLNRTPSASDRTTWTWSAWVKRGTISTQQYLFQARIDDGGTDTNKLSFFFNSDDTLNVFSQVTVFRKTNAVFRDPAAWYHIVLVADTSNATANNRFRLYINNVEQTYQTLNNPSSALTTAVNSANPHYIASEGGSTLFDGYLGEINFIDGQALTPSSFGKTDAVTGQWIPKKFGGAYGTNGFYLKFADASAATAAAIGKDSSPNGNNWTPNNISVTAGVTYDAMIDSPSLSAVASNYATWNPLAKGSEVTLANGNLEASWTGSSGHTVYATIGFPTTGKWYCEMTGAYQVSFGLVPTSSYFVTSQVGYPNTGIGYRGTDGQKMVNGTPSAYGATYGTSDIIAVVYDADALSLRFYKNNVDQGAITVASDSYTLAVGYQTTSAGTAKINFGQRPFTYTPPSGFKSLNTFNLP